MIAGNQVAACVRHIQRYILTDLRSAPELPIE